MFLDMTPVRPRVLPEELRRVLNDLRGFRHLFRHAYDFQLDPRRLEVLLNDWDRSRQQILGSLKSFSASVQ